MGSSSSRIEVDGRTVVVEGYDVFDMYLHTGNKFPQKDVIKKWHQGSINITVNPGANENLQEPDCHESRVLKITGRFPKDCEGAVVEEYWIPGCKQIGEPKVVKIEIDATNPSPNPLYIREVTIVWNLSTIYRFPVHAYLSARSLGEKQKDSPYDKKKCLTYHYSRSGMGTLKFRETEVFVLEAREEELMNIRKMVEWHWKDPGNNEAREVGIPNYISWATYEELPRFLQFRDARLNAFEGSISTSTKELVPALAVNLLKNIGKSPAERNFASFMDYENCFEKMGEYTGWKRGDIREGLRVGEIFKEDKEFARQIIQGPNSRLLRRVTDLSGRWKEGIDHLPPYAIDGEDIFTVLEEGRLYEVSNSKTLEGVANGGKQSLLIAGSKEIWYVILADCLLYLSKKKSCTDNEGQEAEQRFVPVLIRLENKNDGERQTWWHPPTDGTLSTDPKYLSWLLAKMHFRCADWQGYSLGTHFARAHAMNEPFAISMHRNLPSAHPLFRLLQPHFEGIIGINVQARQHLIAAANNAFARFMSAGDNLPTLLKNCCKEMHYDHMVMPDHFEKRGLLDIPNFYFRDDCMSIWSILLRYVGEMVDLSYESDDWVTNDEELQLFVKEICKLGFEALDGAGFPDSLHTKEKLVEYLTVLIFNVSCYHTAVNFQINKYLGYLPNAPASVRMPPPKQDDVVTMEHILSTLPGYGVALVTMAISEVLGNFSPIERFYVETRSKNRIGYLGHNMAVAPEQEACIRNMVKEMEKLRDKITERNVGSFLPYNVLSPDNIPITTQT